MLLYIVRHGETDLNSKGVLQGHIDVPLNASGIFLAEETGRNMRGIHFDRCISSPLSRAKKTVELILKESGNGDVPIETDERIMEINGGVYEGRKLSEGPIPNGEARRFFTDPVHFAGFPGGETYDDVKKRTQDFLKDMCAISDDKMDRERQASFSAKCRDRGHRAVYCRRSHRERLLGRHQACNNYQRIICCRRRCRRLSTEIRDRCSCRGRDRSIIGSRVYISKSRK